MIKFKHQFNPEYTPDIGETNDQASQTTPDMSLTVKTLLSNHTRGIHSNIKTYDGEYFGDSEIPQFDDIADAHNYKLDLKAKLRETEKTIATEIEALKQANIKAAREKALADKQIQPTPLETPPEPPPPSSET